MTKIITSYSAVLISCYIIFLSGCAVTTGSQRATSSPTERNNSVGTSVNSTVTLLVTSSPTRANPTRSPKNTQPPIQTSTPKPSVSPTWTNIPTLPPKEALEALLELYKDNGGCQLPCWWGITPGTTSWEAAREILFSVGDVHGPLISNGTMLYEPEFIVPDNIDPLGYIWPFVWVDDSKIIAIGTNGGWIKQDFDYSLSGILSSFGVPDEIWLEIITDTMSTPHYNMRLFYSTKGIEIGSSGDVDIVDNRIFICPQKLEQGVFPPGILTWFPSNEITFKNLKTKLLGNLSSRNTDKYILLEEVTVRYNPETFYNTFIDPNVRTCIDVYYAAPR